MKIASKLAVPTLVATALLASTSMPSMAGAVRVVTPSHPAPYSAGMLIENGVPVPRTHIMLPRGVHRPTPDGLLPYNGGPIQKTPKVYVTFWHYNIGDPQGVANYLQSYIGGIGASSWLNTVTQYYSNSQGHITNPSGQLAGVWFDNSGRIARHPGDFAVQSEANRSASHFGGANANALYIVATPHGHSISGFGTQFCAYHGYTGTVAYTNLPYMPDAGANCGAGSVNNPGTDDGVSIVSGHEIAETQTDPQPPSGWSGSQGEIGDLCAWINLQDIVFSTGTFPVQPLYSDANNGCVQHYP
jgi:serine protease